MACLIILTRGDICKYSRIIYLIIICKYSGIIYLIVIILKESLQKSYFPPATSGIWMSQFVSKKIHNVQVFCNENLDFARPPSPLEKKTVLLDIILSTVEGRNGRFEQQTNLQNVKFRPSLKWKWRKWMKMPLMKKMAMAWNCCRQV